MAVKIHPENYKKKVKLGVRFSWLSDIYMMLKTMHVIMNFSN